MSGYKKNWNDIIFLRLKKHHCPNCNYIMSVVTCEKTVNSNSEEAKKFDFYSFDTYLVGNIQFVWDELQCYNCGLQLTAKEMKQYEKPRKK